MSKAKLTEQYGGAICGGGVISDSMHIAMIKKHGVWADIMCYRLSDKKYDRFIAYKKQGKMKEAQKIFDKYAYDPLA